MLCRVGILASVLLLPGAAFAHATLDDTQVRHRLAGLQVPFIVNRGQVDARVAYYAQTFAGTLYVTTRARWSKRFRGGGPTGPRAPAIPAGA